MSIFLLHGQWNQITIYQTDLSQPVQIKLPHVGLVRKYQTWSTLKSLAPATCWVLKTIFWALETIV